MNIIDTKGKKGYNPKERFKVVETKPLTNYDRLISKTPEEMASLIAANIDCERCKLIHHAEDGLCPTEYGKACSDLWINWVKAQADKDKQI